MDRFDEKAREIAVASGCSAYEYGALRDRVAAALREADRAAREDCAQIADAHASCEGIAQKVAEDIRATINQEGK